MFGIEVESMSAALRHRIARVLQRQYEIDDEHESERARLEVDALLAETQSPLPEYPPGWDWLRLWRGASTAHKLSKR